VKVLGKLQELIVRVVVIDLIVLVGAAVLVTENPHRWPIFLVVGPALFFINLKGLRRLTGGDPGAKARG